MDKKELIRRYALETIAEYGFHNTKVQMIADRADISVGTIYNYFKSKEEILNYIFEVEHNKVINLMNKINENTKSGLDKIKALLEGQFQQLMDNPDIVKILIQDGLQHSEYSNNIKIMSYALISQFSQFIEEGKKKGEIKEVNSAL